MDLRVESLCLSKHIQGHVLDQQCGAMLQGLAFVGSEVITFNAVTNSALQSEWLAALLQVIP